MRLWEEFITGARVALLLGIASMCAWCEGCATPEEQSGDSWLAEGRALAAQGRRLEAGYCFNQAVWIDPGFAPAWKEKAAFEFADGRRAEAAASYRRYLALEPSDGEAWRLLGTVHMELAQADNALASFDKALALAPKNARLWILKGLVYLKLLDRPEDALPFFEKACALDRKDAEAWNYRLTSLMLPRYYREAAACLEEARAAGVKVSPSLRQELESALAKLGAGASR
jgi:tetratricopeptide (TPR) repeat protein